MALLFYGLLYHFIFLFAFLQINGLALFLPPHAVDNNLIGPIPSEIAALENLDVLVLEKNQLKGKLPDTFNAGLNRLRLNLNFLSGTVPSTLSNRLISLDLTGNRFTGTLNDLIESVPRIKQLEIGDNYFTGTIPSGLGDLSSISKCFYWWKCQSLASIFICSRFHHLTAHISILSFLFQ